MAKHFEWRSTKCVFNLGEEIIERHRRVVAVQPGKFSGPCRREQILSCREHLAKFYKRRSELLEGKPRALMWFQMRDFGSFPPVQYLSCMLEQGGNTSAAHKVSKPMPHEDRADLAQSRQLAGRAEAPGDHRLLFALLRLALVAQSICDARQYATGKHSHARACAADRRQPRRSTYAVGKLPHNACNTNARLHTEVL